ncbi:MAG: hypothetical protein AABX14_03615 [Candidatus Aenigmatarchaeota archaeon]
MKSGGSRGYLSETTRKVAMRSLLSLTEEASDPNTYFNRVSIALGIPIREFHGEVAERDVPKLLEPYIDKCYVKVARIRHHTGGKEHIGYRADLSRRQQIEEELIKP